MQHNQVSQQQYYSNSKSQTGVTGAQQLILVDRGDMSSRLSSVKLTDEYESERSARQSFIRPSQLDRMASLINFKEKIIHAFSTDNSSHLLDGGTGQQSSQGARKNSRGTELSKSKRNATKFSFGSRTGTIFNKFNIAYIMSSIDVGKLKLLKDKFRQKFETCEVGFELNEFVMLMKKVIPYEHPAEETDLVHGLITLYNEIDINRNGFLEWDEFTGFLIEAVDQKQLQQGKLANDELVSENVVAQALLRLEESQPDYLHTNNMLQVARSQIFQKFNLSSTFKDRLVRNTAIVSAILYHATDSFITLEHQARSVKFISAMSNQAIPGIASKTRQTTKVNEQIHLPASGSNYILSVAFNEKDRVVALCATDGMMYFYRRYGNQSDWKLFKIICSHGIVCQVNIWYMEHHQRWFTIGSQQQGTYSRKNIRVGQVLTLHQWDIPRSKWLSNKQMVCDTCQEAWTRSRASTEKSGSTGGLYDHVIERPFVETFPEADATRDDADLRYLVEPFEHMNHRDDVKDVREIYHPFLAIITACHDGKLRVIDAVHMRRVIGILHSGHATGIRQIDYTPYHGAAIISSGYESFFNLWEIDNSVSFAKQMKDMATKFTLVSHPCIAARFLGRSVFCAAVDSQFLVKIWDYKKRELMQSLQLNSLKLQDTISGMLIFSEGKFAVLSKHITFYDNLIQKMAEVDTPSNVIKKKDLEIRRLILQEKGLSEIQQAANQQRNFMINPPIDVVFLESYQNFLVMTKDSLRLYNGKNGRLCMYLDNICEKDEFTQVAQDLSAMCLNAEHRIVFVGDIQGRVRCYNVNTGICIARLDVDPAMQQRQGELNPKVNREIAMMQFVQVSQDHHFLVSAQWNSRIRIWDVGDMTNAHHLRTASAQKVFNEDIRCVAVSDHLSLISTGSTLGKIVMWDQELLRCEGVMIGAKGTIIALQFIEKYPMLLSAGTCGTISVFAVRGCPSIIRQYCLGRFLNLGLDPNKKQVNTAITAMACEVVSNPRYDRDRKPPKSELSACLNYYFDQRMTYRKEDCDRDVNWYCKSVFLARQDVKFQKYKAVFNEESPLKPKNQPQAAASKTMSEKTRDSGKVQIQGQNTKGDKESKDAEEGIFDCEEQDVYAKKFFPPFNNQENPEFLNIVYSDENGSIKWLDLTTFIRMPLDPIKDESELMQLQADPLAPAAPYIGRCTKYAESKVGFMPSRRMETEAGSVAISFLEMNKNRKQPRLVLACRSVQLKSIENAHKGRVNNIRRINVEPYGYVTCGNDKFVRIWSRWGTKVGEINLIKENTKLNEWKFGYNWADKKLKEQKKARSIVEKLRMSTIVESNTEYHSGATQATQGNEAFITQKNQIRETILTGKQKKKENKFSFSRPALDKLVSSNGEDENQKAQMQPGASKESQNKQDQDQSEAKKSIEKIEEMFPIRKRRDKQNDPQVDSKVATLIDKAIKNRFQKQHPLIVNKRLSLSQQGFRPASGLSKTPGDFSANRRKSSMKNSSSLAHQTAYAKKAGNRIGQSRISFKEIEEEANGVVFQQLDEGGAAVESGEAASQEKYQQTERTGTSLSGGQDELDSIQKKIKIKEAKSMSSSGSSSGAEDVRDNVFEDGAFHSRADIKLARQLELINNDVNPRSTNLFKKIPTKAQRDGSQSKFDQQNNNKFKSIESRHEKLSQRSSTAADTLNNFTAVSAATREKWQQQNTMKQVNKQPKIASSLKFQRVKDASAAGLSKDVSKQRISLTRTPNMASREKAQVFRKSKFEDFRNNKIQSDQKTSGEGTANIEDDEDEEIDQNSVNKLSATLQLKKHRVIQIANERNNQHLKQLIEECQSRHDQMVKYIEQRNKTGDAAGAVVQDFANELQDILVGSNQAKTTHKKQQQQQQNEDSKNDILKQSGNGLQRPPKAINKMRQSKPSATMSQSFAAKKKQHNYRLNTYINEASSNNASDQRFMLRYSHSVDKLQRNNAAAINSSASLQDPGQKVMHHVNNQRGLTPKDQRQGSEMKEVREMQKRIARHISQKAFIRSGNITNLHDQVINEVHGAEIASQSDLETQKKEQAMNMRQLHLMKKPSNIQQQKTSSFGRY